MNVGYTTLTKKKKKENRFRNAIANVEHPENEKFNRI